MSDEGRSAIIQSPAAPNLVAVLRARSHETHTQFDSLCESGWRTIEEQAADEIERLHAEINAMHEEINGVRTG